MPSAISGITLSPIIAHPKCKSPSGAASAASALTTPSTGKSHKGKSSAASNIFQQIEQAVTSALQSVSQSDASNPNDAVQNAIEQVFSQNPQGTGNTAESDAANLVSAAGGTNDAAHTTFAQALKAHGIDPEQFQTDFLHAVKDAQNGAVNVGAALKNLPTGSLLDTTA